jgi:nucleotide-binding universal stress UspA family protein
MYKHILIATDGSELARKGVDHGLALAARLGARVTILTVTHPMRPEAIRAAQLAGIDDPVVRYDQQIDAEMEAQFAQLREEAHRHGAEVDLVHEIDDYPAEAIIRVANLRGCDLIVMTSHGRRGARRLILGSQTAEVVTHTTLPVLVIR